METQNCRSREKVPKSKRNEPRKQRFNVASCNPLQRNQATSQEGVKKRHLYFKTSQQFLVVGTETKAQSEKSMNVTDMKVTDEDGFSVSEQNDQSKQQDCERFTLNRTRQVGPFQGVQARARCHICETQW